MAPLETISDQAWRDFEKQLRTYVRSRVDPQSVDDVIGSILMRLVRNSAALLAADNPAAYVQRVSANMIADFYRRRSAERRALSRFGREAEAQEDGNAAAGEDAHQDISRCMHPFIRRLPKRYREALVLTEIEQMTQREAAERLGLSVSGLKSRVQRGREQLKRAVMRCCVLEVDRRGQVIDYERTPQGCADGC